MKTLSKEDLAKRTAGGATVKRVMGAQKPAEKPVDAPAKPVDKPEPKSEPTELSRSLDSLVEQHALTSAIVAQNAEVLKELFAELATVVAKMSPSPVSIEFKIKRNRVGFMDSIVAIPNYSNQAVH